MTKPKKTRVSRAELAQRLGVSRKRVASAIQRGEISADCLSKDGAGRTVITDGDKAEAQLAPRVALTQQEREPTELPDGLDFENPDSWPRDLDGLKIVREWWVARQAKRKDDLASGELVQVATVRADIFAAARTARDHLLNVPGRVADDLAAELDLEDVEPVRRVLRDSIERTLTDLADALESV